MFNSLSVHTRVFTSSLSPLRPRTIVYVRIPVACKRGKKFSKAPQSVMSERDALPIVPLSEAHTLSILPLSNSHEAMS